jgi:hypothetical protein
MIKPSQLHQIAGCIKSSKFIDYLSRENLKAFAKKRKNRGREIKRDKTNIEIIEITVINLMKSYRRCMYGCLGNVNLLDKSLSFNLEKSARQRTLFAI